VNEDTLNMEIRKFLKNVGVSSQREIEHTILKAVESGDLSGEETLAVSMTLKISTIGLNHVIEGTIALE
jgi:hypothetical protein